jgi:hypothetical protein
VTADVIELAPHREVPGTLWCSGVFKCIYCSFEHIAVAPMPAWATAPMPGQCPKCKRFGALAMAGEMPEALNADPDEPPWYTKEDGAEDAQLIETKIELLAAVARDLEGRLVTLEGEADS